MGKHTLSNVDGFISRSGEIYLVDPSTIKVVNGWNKRTDFSGEEELMGVIKELGVPPVLVRKNTNNILELADGERRLRATKRLIAEGIELKGIRVTVAPKGTNDIDLCLSAVALNNGKKLLPTEEADFFKQLFVWGLSRQEIATKTGTPLSTVRNRLGLSNAIPAVKKAVSENKITIKQANEIVEKSDGKVDTQVEQLEIEKSTPRTRTKKPKIVAYLDNELCVSINCPRLENKLIGKSECHYANNCCIMTAMELLKWFSEKGFKITKEVLS